jgi:predicted Zn-dependent protease with MMP-like domain
MDAEGFSELVNKAVEGLPAEFAERLDNVAIVVEDMPTRSQLRRVKVSPDKTLLGLYEGIPHTRRGSDYGLVLPDKITIFKKPIEANCKNDTELVALIRKVVLHEIAHHFGISDARLEELEK